MLIENGADVDAADDAQWSVLQHAVYYGHLKITQVGWHIPQWSLAHIAHAILIPQELIDSGADIHAVTHQEWTALHAAARYGHTDIVKASFCFT